jgi:DNA-binding transcriptional regulator YhcF (GntR family)
MSDRIIGYGLVDLKTGEISKEFLFLRKTTNIGGLWMRAYQNSMARLATLKLRGESYRLVWYLVAHTGYLNKPPSVKSIAKGLGIKPPHISRAFKELEKNGIVIKDDNIYSLNPYFFWKGTSKQLETRLEELRTKNLELLKELGTTPELMINEYKQSEKEYKETTE